MPEQQNAPSAWHPDWLVPDWPAPASVQAVCTTRAGGCSQDIFESLNLGLHVADDPLAVQANRITLAQALAVRPVFMQQVHGTQVLALDDAVPDGLCADASTSTQPGLACTVMVADCLPVLFAHTGRAWVGAAHAGWRGLAGLRTDGSLGAGVLESTLAQLAASTRLALTDAAAGTLAWLGPCIGPSAFEVGPEVRQAFVVHQPEAAALFKPSGAHKFLADLSGLARLRLRALGVTQIYGNDGSDAWCTVTQASRFFSHRRVAGRVGAQAGETGGRFAACVWLR